MTVPRSAVALVAWLTGSTLVLGLGACGAERPPQPELRQVGIGFEDVAVVDQDWAAMEARLDAAGATGVGIAAGRVEWTAFAWPEHPEAAAPVVAESGRDLLGEAVEALRTDGSGDPRHVTLTIDALVPAMIAADPSLAARSPEGETSPEFASASALEGEVGDRIVALAAELARRYRPDEVSLTELMFDAWSFGADDLASYRDASGEVDWPRRADGGVDVGAAAIGTWRSGIVAALVDRVAEAVHPWGAGVAIDVRVDAEHPGRGRPESGHDYGMLAGVADRVVLWHYFGISGAPPESGQALTAALAAAGLPPERALVLVGMWGQGERRIGADELAAGLTHAVGDGVGGVGVTPLSLLEDDDWAAIGGAWR